MTNINKVIRDGRVGVLYSPGYGAGFYTWGAPLESIFDPFIIELVEKKEELVSSLGYKAYESEEYNTIVEEIEIYLERTYEDIYTGGVRDLEVAWVDEGQQFVIKEYDGAETIVLLQDLDVIKI